MNAWETEDEWVAAISSLPTPADIPYRTPSRASRGSRRSSRHRQHSVSPGPSSSSPPPMPPGDKSHHRNSRDIANDESIPESDMRRFTPTLHANLVSEILARRRDLEERDKTMDALQSARRRDLEERDQVIDALQADLHDQRGVHEQYEAERVIATNQNKSLQRELEALKSGNSTALASLADELKAAEKATADYKSRLEAALKRIRSQDASEIRVQKLHDKEKENMEERARKLELKAHVAEVQRNAETVRVRALQEENASLQKIIQNGRGRENKMEETTKDPEIASVRTMSLTNSIRFSMLGGPNGYGGKLNGVSLADELNFDDYDEEDLQIDHEGRESVLSMAHKRNLSRESVMSRSHRRNQSNESLMRPGSVVRGRLLAQQPVLERLKDGIQEDDEIPKVEYVDTGIQLPPPPSPKMQAIEIVSVIEPIESFEPPIFSKIQAIEIVSVIEPVEHFEPIEYFEPIVVGIQVPIPNGKIEPPAELAPREWEIEANQRRKRVHATPTLAIEISSSSSMVSSASQTLEDPLSPPRTPISPTRAPPPPPVTEPVQEMISISTQTDTLVPPPQSLLRAPPPPPIAIPSIQLHPPNSAPATPHEPLLPQHFKHVGCQVNLHVSVPTRSISVQTEEIRVDKRRMKLLPLNLQPSTISSQPPSPEPFADSRQFSPVPGNLPPRNPRRVTRSSLESEVPSSPPEILMHSYVESRETRDAYPGNNDDGPLAKDRGSIRRPPRISSLFAGFENVSSDDADDFADGDLSDNDYRTALSPNPVSTITIGRVAVRRIQTGPSSVPEEMELSEVSKPFAGRSVTRHMNSHDVDSDYVFPKVQIYPTRTSSKPIRQLDKPLTLVTNTKPNAFRRAALVQSGVAAHQGRVRSPSFPELPVTEPPFPIPTRASSRRPPVSVSAPSDGNRSPTYGREGPSRGPYRANSIRKTRSAAALPRGGRTHRRQGSRSPPPMSASTEAPESPRLPYMSSNEITTPRYMRDTGSSRYRSSSHRQQPSTTTANTSYTTHTAATTTATVETPSHATSVVDAIAQTMVGEWMFKYVRRRKSFGVAESNGVDGTESGNGVRHKRWVWLAPYERAVMWSNKQPTSGSALMGKAGRKLTIQSVLDVKDDNPPPKGEPGVFNRSILILTPARALKFTATTPERHYVWLTALSFLAHSSQAVPEIMQAPLPIQQPAIPNFEIPRQANRLRRGGIKDSIRVAKGKRVVARQVSTSVQPSRPNHSVREVDSFYSPRASVDTSAAAEPPIVPRFTDRTSSNGPPLSHGRKRSNTGSRIPPPLSFRGFSGPASSSSHAPTSSTAEQSIGTAGSSDIYQTQSQPSNSVAGYNGMGISGRSSIRTSNASGRPGAVVSNFFDAVGTMRMEAFISPMALSRFDDYPDEQDEMDMVGMNKRHSRERRHRKRDSYYSSKGRPSDDLFSGSRTAGEEDYFGSGYGHDPFRGL